MLETALSLLGSATGGGLVGLIGTAVKGWQEAQEAEAERQHEQSMRQLDQEEMRLEADLQIKTAEAEYAGKAKVARIEGEAAAEVAAQETQTASYDHDQARYSQGALKNMSGWWADLWRGLLVAVDVARGLMRPGITAFLLVIETLVAWHLYQLVHALGGVPADQAWPLLEQVILSVTFLASTAVTWWFGSRPNQRGPARQGAG